MAKQPASSPTTAKPLYRASLSPAEREQVQAALGKDAAPHEAYAALRIVLLSSPGDLETTVKPDAARAMLADALAAIPA